MTPSTPQRNLFADAKMGIGLAMPAKKTAKPAAKAAKKTASEPKKSATSGRGRVGTKRNVRLPDDLWQALRQIADDRGATEASTVRQACENFVRQVAAGQELADIEKNIAQTLSRAHRLAALANETAEKTRKEMRQQGVYIQFLIAMCDQLVRFVFKSTPEIVLPDAADRMERVRYEVLLEDLGAQFANTKIAAIFKQVIPSVLANELSSDGLQPAPAVVPDSPITEKE